LEIITWHGDCHTLQLQRRDASYPDTRLLINNEWTKPITPAIQILTFDKATNASLVALKAGELSQMRDVAGNTTPVQGVRRRHREGQRQLQWRSCVRGSFRRRGPDQGVVLGVMCHNDLPIPCPGRDASANKFALGYEYFPSKPHRSSLRPITSLRGL
jgi:hypothetical protein